MDIQSTVLNGVASILGIFVSVFFAAMIAFVKQHFSAKQIATAGDIALEAVNFATQAAKKHGITADLGKFNSALVKARELASKAGINLSDSQWETLLESAYKKGKNELESLIGTATPYTSDEISNMIASEVAKVVPVAPVIDIATLVSQELSKYQMSVNVTPIGPTIAPESGPEVVPAVPEVVPAPVITPAVAVDSVVVEPTPTVDPVQ